MTNLRPHDIRDPESFSARLWADIDDAQFAAIIGHPFVTGLSDGTLSPDAFAHYVAQDMHYLRDYSRALSIVSAKAPTPADTAMFAQHSADVFDVELQLHNELLPQLGIESAAIDAVPLTPTTQAYNSYLLATAYGGSFVDGLAAVLPCYWIYARVGTELLHRGSPDPRYQLWINTYAGDEFNASVAEVLDLTDRVGRTLTDADKAVARKHFATTSRYEWMFFDAGYRLQTWPV